MKAVSYQSTGITELHLYLLLSIPAKTEQYFKLLSTSTAFPFGYHYHFDCLSKLLKPEMPHPMCFTICGMLKVS